MLSYYASCSLTFSMRAWPKLPLQAAIDIFQSPVPPSLEGLTQFGHSLLLGVPVFFPSKRLVITTLEIFLQQLVVARDGEM